MLHVFSNDLFPVIVRTRIVVCVPFFITLSQAKHFLLLMTTFNFLSLNLALILLLKGFTFGKVENVVVDPFP